MKVVVVGLVLMLVRRETRRRSIGNPGFLQRKIPAAIKSNLKTFISSLRLVRTPLFSPPLTSKLTRSERSMLPALQQNYVPFPLCLPHSFSPTRNSFAPLFERRNVEVQRESGENKLLKGF